jgi:hypothetical protein
MLHTYEEDDADMFLYAIEKGFVQVDPRLIVDLQAHYEEEKVLQWCNEQWSEVEVLTCIATYSYEHKRVSRNTTWVNKEYHYVSRFFFKHIDNAMLFKLVFSDGLAKLPEGAYQLFLR